MADDRIPDDVRDFIVRHIDSVAQLEALLLLRNNPGQSWDVPAAAKRLYASEQEVLGVLSRLRDDGLVSFNDGIFVYVGGSEQVREVVDRLSEVYARQLISVTNIIHAKPRHIRQFSDAFKFKKDR